MPGIFNDKGAEILKANYHTHTPRCMHAIGTEREYIENAIKSGFKILGFSDHTPQFYSDGYVSGMRMLPDMAEEYVRCISKLADEYKKDIKIYVGFEAEYFPECFEKLRKLCLDIGADYLIMGQHFLDRENGGIYTGSPTGSHSILKSYVDQVLEGISTGCFSYIAHPDICNFNGDRELYNSEITRLCRGAKECSVPLEINMLGYSDGRHYPSREFFEIAKREGNDVIIGCDAHSPDSLSDITMQNSMEKFARTLGIVPLESLDLKKIR